MRNDKQRRILIVTQNFFPETFGINDITEDMVKRGYKVDVLTGLPNYPQGKFYDGYSIFRRGARQYKGAKLHRSMVFPRLRNSSIGISLNYATFAICACFRSIPLLFKRYHKIFVYEPSPLFQAIPAQFAGLFNRCEKIIYVLDIWPESVYSVVDFQNKTARKMLRNYSRRTYNRFDKLLITSKGFRQPLLDFGIENEKIEYVPQWVANYEPNHDDTVSQKYKGTFNIVFTGNVGIPQNLGILFDTAKIIDEKYKVKFIIVGDGDYLPDFIKGVKDNGVEDKFDFVGRKPYNDMPLYYDVADCLFVSLKDIDLFTKIVPAKVQAYMTAGKPILCSINGESAETVIEAECGLTSNANDADMLRDNIVKLYNMSLKERDAMGKNGQVYANKYYNREKLLDKIDKILHE